MRTFERTHPWISFQINCGGRGQVCGCTWASVDVAGKSKDEMKPLRSSNSRRARLPKRLSGELRVPAS